MQHYKRICALLIVLCLAVGFVPLGTFAAENTESRIVKQQILLGDDLTMRFYAYIRPEHRDTGVMNIRVGNRTVSYTVAEQTANEDGYYVFNMDLDATEMTEDITVSLETAPVNGPLKISGVWFVSKEDFTQMQISNGNVVDLNSGEKFEPVITEYLRATMPAYEGGEIGADATLVTIGEDPAWGGIVSQATMKAAEGITQVGSQKSVVIDSPINEGYFSQSGATYPLFSVNCAWRELDTASQDLMFYIELPEASSSIRLNSLACNSWSIYPTGRGMQYQYLSMDSLEWQNGTVSNDDSRMLSLTPGFKGYIRLKVDTATNADTFPNSKKLTVQEFSFRGEAFGGEYGPMKLGGVWFVSKEDFTNIQVGDGAVIPMTAADDPGRDYLLAVQPAAEAGQIGAESTLVTLQKDEAWGNIPSQVNMKAAWGITPIGEQKSVAIDSPICEGYFNETGCTYPIMSVNCGWGKLNTAAQDVMFYVELPWSCSGLRINSLACNSWSFWVDPSGMQYQYLPLNGSEWIDSAISSDNNKDLSLPAGFKGYVRLRINTAGNAEAFPAETLTVQDFSFQCQRFGGAPIFCSQYSVRDYARYILENNYSAETKNLVKQMLNYGAKAQLHFGNLTHKLANAGYEVESTGTIGTDAPDILIDGVVDGISFYGCSILLQSKLATRYYFRAPNGINGYTFRVGDTEVIPEAKDGMFYVEEIGITPDRMDSLTTVTVTKNSQQMTVQYSPMCYITRMYNKSTTSQSMKDMLLAAAGYFEAAKAFTGVKVDDYVDFTTELPALSGTQDDLLVYNPDRGWRLEAYVNVAGTGDPAQEIISGLAYYKDYNPQLCQTYLYLTDYKDTPTIPQQALDRIQQVFDTAREKGIKLLVRFAYQSDMEGTGEASDEIMLAHMPQLRPVLAANTDVIHTVEAGFLGAWGEWHSYKMEHDKLALLKGILDMVPENLYVQVRRPSIKNVLINAEPNDPNLQRMGYHDDSFFGWQYAKWNDGLNPGEGEWEQMREESAYAPQGGEMFWGCQYNQWAPTTGEMAIRKYSAFHQNSFSLYHSFIEDGLVHWVKELHKDDPDLGHYSMRDWLTEPVTQQLLDSYGVAYDPVWFQDESGQQIQRFAFEFVQEHLGYRLRALDVTLNGSPVCGSALQVSLNLKNTGFSAAFHMESGFAVMDKDGNVISTVAAGDPASWLPANPDTREALTHNVAATLQLPNQPGTYQIAFYVKNSAGTGARLANDLPFIDGYTVIQTVELP